MMCMHVSFPKATEVALLLRMVIMLTSALPVSCAGGRCHDAGRGRQGLHKED